MYSKDRRLWIEKRQIKSVYKTLYCRTEKIGVAVYRCQSCDMTKQVYRSCGDRFCPKCGYEATQRWARDSLSKLCMMKHHHVVFTLPKQLRSIAQMNGELFYDILFKSTSWGLKRWFSKKHRLIPGIVSVLHTAGSDLKYHPHIHMVVTGGGLSMDRMEVEELETDYLTRQRFLAEKFKQSFYKYLFTAHNKKVLKLPKCFQDDPKKFVEWARGIRDKHWIASIQKPLHTLDQIVGYVGRYTKRACLSEYKIAYVDEGRISIYYNDYKNTPKGERPLQSIRHFTPFEFLDELLQHVPYPGFKMVRYTGIYSSHYVSQIANYNKTQENKQRENRPSIWTENFLDQFKKLSDKSKLYECPSCSKEMTFVELLFPSKQYIDDS